jgi:Flp pilus assembly pilin Flp
MKGLIKKLWNDESAQGATEYILMLVVVVTIAIAFKDQLRDIINKKTADLGGKIQGFE